MDFSRGLYEWLEDDILVVVEESRVLGSVLGTFNAIYLFIRRISLYPLAICISSPYATPLIRLL
jgi:hypothetical protein